MSDLSLTRTMLAEHSYPTPTRNHLSMHNREAAKRAMNRKTRAGEVRIGIRSPEGLTVMGTTASEDAQRRQMELLDKALERKQRQQATMDRLNESQARIDSWAHKD